MLTETEIPSPSTIQMPKAPTRSASFLANKQLWLLFAGQALINTTYYLFTVVLTVWVFERTRSGTAVSWVLVAGSLSPLVLGPLAGVCIDRWNRKLIMVGAVLTLALLALLPVLAPLSLRLPAIYLSALLCAAASCFIMPAKSGILQAIVPKAHQEPAAYWSAALFTIGSVAGAALAAPLYFLVGPILALGTMTALFVFTTLFLLAIRLPRAARSLSQASGLAHSVLGIGRELSRGLRFVVRTRTLRQVLICTSLVMACASAFNAMNLVFVTQRLQVSTEMIGPINIAVSVGTLLGSFLAGLLMRWIAPRYMFAGGILVLGIGVTLYSQLSWYWPALICIGLATLPQSGVDMGLGPMLVTSSPPDLIGRAQSVVETSMLGSGLVATALAGFVVQFLPVEFIIASAGLLAVLSGVIALYGLRRQPAPNQQGPSR